mgnify:CR=1 FL=1
MKTGIYPWEILVVVAIIIFGLFASIRGTYSLADGEYRRGLEDGLMAGRTEAYVILRKSSRTNAENYWIRLQNEVKDKGIWYPLEMIGEGEQR